MEASITLNPKEQKRLVVLNAVVAGQSTVAEAAASLGLSGRQVRRVLAAYRREGAAALAHGNRGRRPAHATSQAVIEQVLGLAQTTYQGCNQQHLRDLLAEREGITLSRATIHRLLAGAGRLASPARRLPQHRRRRERRSQEGQLVRVPDGRARHGRRSTWPALLTRATAAWRVGARSLAAYVRPDLLVLDDFGLTPSADPAPADLYDVVNERYEVGSILVTSNRAPTEWPDLFRDPLLASAGLDRLAHHAETIVITGRSYRAQGRQPTADAPAPGRGKGGETTTNSHEAMSGDLPVCTIAGDPDVRCCR